MKRYANAIPSMPETAKPALKGDDLDQKGVADRLTDSFGILAQLNGRQYDSYDELKARMRAMAQDFSDALDGDDGHRRAVLARAIVFANDTAKLADVFRVQEIAVRRDIRPRQAQAVYEYVASNAYKDRGRGIYDTLTMTDDWAGTFRRLDGNRGDSEE